MLNFIRGLVRPTLLLSGWGVVLAVMVMLANKYATAENFVSLLSFILGSLATMVGFYFRDRIGSKQDGK